MFFHYKTKTTWLAYGLSLILFLAYGQAKGQPGTNDATFNVLDNTSGFNNIVSALSVQLDGKIIVGGHFSTFNGTARSRIARLNADGTLDTGFNPGSGFNNSPSALYVQSDGKIVIGGTFTTFNGTTCNHITRLNADGTLDTGFNPGTGFNHWVNALSVQPDGKIIVGGFFSTFNGTNRNKIARLNADGTLDTGFNPGTGFIGSSSTAVNALSIQSDGKIVVGGDFTSFDGTNRSMITRLNVDGTLDTSFNPGTGFSSYVTDLFVQPDGKIVAGGAFNIFNSTTRRKIARLNTDGTLDTGFNPGTGFDSNVLALSVQSDGKILVGGQFTTFNGTNHTRIARLNINGGLDTSFNPGTGFNNDVYDLPIQSDGKIVVGGAFGTFNGATRSQITRLNVDGSEDTFLPIKGFNNEVLALSVQSDGKILVGGYFTAFNDTPCNRLARLNTDGSLNTSFGAGFSGLVGTNVRALSVQSDGKIVIGGYFTSFDGTSCSMITRLNADGTLDTGFNSGSGFNNWVKALSVQPDGKIVVGGEFTNFNGTSRNRIARLNADGSLDTSFDPGSGLNGGVSALSIQSDGKILIGGTFNTFNGISHNYIARLNVDGSLDTGFTPGSGFNNWVNALSVQQDGKIVVGGEFTNFNGTSRNRIARLNADGSLDTSFLPNVGFDNRILSLALQAYGKILVVGNFNTFNGTTRNKIARLNEDGSLDTGFTPGSGFDNWVSALYVQSDNKIVLGGSFINFNGAIRTRIARLHGDIPAPEINLQGNTTNIVDGDASPTATDHTDFGSLVSTGFARTFTIQNTGSLPLTVSNVALSGTDASQFAIAGLPTFPFDVAGMSSQTFTVTFNPTSGGIKNATVSITNNDTDEGVYDFAIRGDFYHVTVANGNWNTGSTWSGGVVPTGGANITIAHTVDLNTNYNTGAYTLTIQNNKSINIKSGQTLTVPSGGTLVNNGILISNVGGNLTNSGTVTNNGILHCWESFTNNNTLNNNGIINNTKTFANVLGATLVNQGIVNNNTNGLLNNNGSFDNNVGVFNNNTGATLGGAGSYVGTLVNDGTFSPGNSPGVFTVNGTFINNGTVRIEIGGNDGAGVATGHDKLQINGDAILGGTVQVVLINSFAPAGLQTYNALNATGSVTNTFATAVFPSASGAWSMSYNATNANVEYNQALPITLLGLKGERVEGLRGEMT
ncbi:MAG: choice-of-anchor D domain-containing protein, partial [Bacteroidetes bacterium]